MEAKDIYNLSFSEIDAIQRDFDVKNITTVDAAFKQGRINEEERSYMLEFFCDSMGVYREVYRSIYETFGQPEETCSFDLKTGQVETDAQGNNINYGLKILTPSTCTRLEYRDKNHNPVYIIIPQMKSAERAVDKIENEYSKETFTAMRAALDKMFQDDDREAFGEKLQNLPKKTSKLHDILRLSFTCKYLSDVEQLKHRLSENKSDFYFINSKETRDRFEKPLKENEKQYYDIKMIIHQKNKEGKVFDVEAQLKIDTLFRGDLRTHAIYEQTRQLETEVDKLDADSFDARQKKAQLKILNNRIKQINQHSIHQYNMTVLDKAFRIEDDGYRPLRVAPDFADGTYRRCRNFISTEYLVASFDNFNSKEAFSADNSLNKLCFLKLIGKLPSDFDEFKEGADKTINEKFDNLENIERRRFEGINEIANKYQSVIQRKIKNRQAKEEGHIPLITAKKSGKSY